jgi:hypothetical protein
VSVLWDSDTTESFITRQFLSHMEGGIHIGMCTGSPEAARRLAKLHADHGSAYVEAPIFGRPDAARARQLTIPYAGPQEAKDRVKPLLTAMGGQALFDMGSQPGVPTVLKQLGNFHFGSALFDGGSHRRGMFGCRSNGCREFADGDAIPGTNLSQLRQGLCGKEESPHRITNSC